MRKGMAYGRMRQIDKMSMDEFKRLPEAERELYLRTEQPLAQRMAVMDRLAARLNQPEESE